MDVLSQRHTLVSTLEIKAIGFDFIKELYSNDMITLENLGSMLWRYF